MRSAFSALMLSLAILISFSTRAYPDTAEKSMNASGYIRSFATYTIYPSGATESAAIETRIRLKLSGELAEDLRAELAYEIAPVWRENTPVPVSAQAYQGFLYRAEDLEQVLYPDEPGLAETFMVYQNLDRAFVTYRGRSFDLHAGRQPIAFGSARTVNPTDVLAPYPFTTIAKEERIGVDALRLKVPIGKMSEIDTGVVFGREFRTTESAAYMRVKGYLLGTDISAIAMRFRENNLYGLDMARSIGGAGAWIEAAQVFTNTPGNGYYSVSAGTEYFFSDKLYAFIEYHYNGAGEEDRNFYIFNILKEAYTQGGVYLMARNYLAPGMSYQLAPLLGLALSVIYNMDDGSALLAPSMEYNAAENIYIGLGGYAGTGKDGLPSEFGQYPDIWYASLSYYF